MNSNEPPLGVSIHAGFPNPAADKALGGLDLNQLLVQHSSSTFLFRIRGNFWEDRGIFDGDIGVIDRALDPRANDLVICVGELSDDFTLTSYKKIPADTVVWGVVTAIIHQFRSSQKSPA